jgi:hypothetical protein
MFLSVGRFLIRWKFFNLLALRLLQCVPLLIALLPLSAAAQTPANNLQTLLRLCDRVAIRVGEEILRRDQPAVWIQSAPDAKPEERFFSSRLVTVLKDSLQLAVFTEPVDSLRTTALTYHLARCEVVYRKLPDRRFWQNSRWQRTANIIVEAGAENAATRQIDFQKFFAESAADTVPGKFLSRLEEASLPFTIGRREEPPEGFRWLEPVLIASATGAVVYLFYALRSR